MVATRWSRAQAPGRPGSREPRPAAGRRASRRRGVDRRRPGSGEAWRSRWTEVCALAAGRKPPGGAVDARLRPHGRRDLLVGGRDEPPAPAGKSGDSRPRRTRRAARRTSAACRDDRLVLAQQPGDEGRRLTRPAGSGSASSQTRRIPGEADAEKAWSKSAADGAGVPAGAGVLASGGIASRSGEQTVRSPQPDHPAARMTIRTGHQVADGRIAEPRRHAGRRPGRGAAR